MFVTETLSSDIKMEDTTLDGLNELVLETVPKPVSTFAVAPNPKPPTPVDDSDDESPFVDKEEFASYFSDRAGSSSNALIRWSRSANSPAL